MKKCHRGLLLMLFFFIPLAEAQRDSKRESRQESRIKSGANSNTLTSREVKRLESGQDRVDSAQGKAIADGVVSKKEKIKIEKMQDRQSRQIYIQKHDGQFQGRKSPANRSK